MQVVTLPSENAHQELLLPKLAVYASPENLEKYRDVVIPEDTIQYSSQATQKNLPHLSKIVVPLVMSGDIQGDRWTVEPWHVRISLRKFAGIHLNDDDSVKLPSERVVEGPDTRYFFGSKW